MLPNSFILPKIFKRNIKVNHRHYSKKIPLDDFDLRQYDYHTLLYNVFLDYHNNHLILLGPPLLNFAKLFFPLKVYFNNRILNKPVIIKGMKFFILKYKLKDNCGEKNKVKIYTHKNKIYRFFIIRKNHYNCGSRILTTTQKNNKLIWIKDWAEYYKNKYGINNIIIYDNNSDNQKQLIHAFKNTHVTIIPFNITFGPIRGRENRFLQTALLNNTLYQFAKMESYVFNFDIDELLAIDPKRLNQLLQGNVFYKFRQYRVPYIYSGEEYSFSNFKWKDKSSKDEDIGPKYLVSRKKTTSMAIHDCITQHPVQYLDDYFLHYKAITDGWKQLYGIYRLKQEQNTKDCIPIDDIFNY